MCVIIASQSGIMPSDEDLTACSLANGDGAGIAWNDGKFLHVQKGITVDDLSREIELARGCPYVLHFRLATHGEISRDNSHPFWLDPTQNGVLAHNGILSGYGSKTLVDTQDYIARRLPQIWGDFAGRPWRNSKKRAKVGKDIGYGNKFAVLDLYGDVSIVNEHLGKRLPEYPDVWFSNDSWTWYSRDRFVSRARELPSAESSKPSTSHYGGMWGYWDNGEWRDFDDVPTERYDLEPLSNDDWPSAWYGKCDLCGEKDDLIKYEGWYVCYACNESWEDIEDPQEETKTKSVGE